MASPWDFDTPIWYERLTVEEYPTFVPAPFSVDGRNTCPYLAGGEARKMVTELSGLDHLDGQGVYIVQDGIVSEDSPQEVISGMIVLSEPAAVVHAGLPYQGQIKMLPLGGDIANLVSETKERKVFDVVFRLWKSLGGMFGKDADHVFPLDYLPTDDVLFTGDLHDIPFESSVDVLWEPVFIQDEPLPFMLLAAVIRSEVFEDK